MALHRLSMVKAAFLREYAAIFRSIALRKKGNSAFLRFWRGEPSNCCHHRVVKAAVT